MKNSKIIMFWLANNFKKNITTKTEAGKSLRNYFNFIFFYTIYENKMAADQRIVYFKLKKVFSKTILLKPLNQFSRRDSENRPNRPKKRYRSLLEGFKKSWLLLCTLTCQFNHQFNYMIASQRQISIYVILKLVGWILKTKIQF